MSRDITLIRIRRRLRLEGIAEMGFYCVFINHLEEEMDSKLVNFANDAELFQLSNAMENCGKFQMNINTLGDLAAK